MASITRIKLVDFKVVSRFDAKAVTDVMDGVTRKALTMASQDVQRKAKGSMKARPLGVASPPGTPPHRHKHSARGANSRSDYALMKSIVYAYDAVTQSAVIGPSIRYGGAIATIAGRHEFGGSMSQKNRRRKLRRLGGAGEVLITKTRPAMRAAGGVGASQYIKNTVIGARWVTYGRLKTKEQARRANMLNAALYGPAIVQVLYPKRPFMRPALEQVAPRMLEYFGKAIK